ncbi:MAG: RodZ domain-containing protein [Pseudomonadota bacterium]
MKRDENNSLSENTGGWQFPPGKELGSLLRNKREKMGLSYAQIFERTRLRPQFLEALENEEWDQLPSPAFVKGFIRSYARVLGLAEDGLVGLYQEIIPRHSAISEPLRPPVHRGKKLPTYLFLIFIFLALGYVSYYWIEDPTQQAVIISKEAAGPADDKLTESRKARDTQGEKAGAPLNTEDLAVDSPAPEKADLGKEGTPATEGSSPGATDQPPGGGQASPLEQSPSLRPERDAEIVATAPNTVFPAETDRPGLVLKANVRGRTWVRIRIDNEKPKEYIFSPESRPEWTAKKGFELLIGNAGGIDLEFNGEKMENLGKQGQVIRLSLPIGYERSISED